MKYIIYSKTGEILRVVECHPTLADKQVKKDTFIMEGNANDATQKVEFDGFDVEGQPVNPRVVDKTLEEIEADNPLIPEIPKSQMQIYITNEQWWDIQDRLSNLEQQLKGK